MKALTVQDLITNSELVGKDRLFNEINSLLKVNSDMLKKGGCVFYGINDMMVISNDTEIVRKIKEAYIEAGWEVGYAEGEQRGCLYFCIRR